jgi:hypothetical protein
VSKFIISATWDDVPHLSAETKAELFASIPPYQRDARSKGIPVLGAGAIYPVPESELLVSDFDIPKHWPRGFGLDVGFNVTAAVWAALDRQSDVLYLYNAYRRGEVEPVTHAAAIKARGEWVPGQIDPASRGRSQVDGRMLLQMYLDLGLKLNTAQNAVETGIYEVWCRMTTGRLRVFRSLQSWLEEYRLYRRDEKGKVVKVADHLMDATRYIICGGLQWLQTAPADDGGYPSLGDHGRYGDGSGRWMS